MFNMSKLVTSVMGFPKKFEKDDLKNENWVCDECLHIFKNITFIKKAFPALQEKIYKEFSALSKRRSYGKGILH